MADQRRLGDLLIEWDERRRSGEQPSAEELCRDCPELADELASRMAALKYTDWMFDDDMPEDEPFLSLPAFREADRDEQQLELPSVSMTAAEFATSVTVSGLLEKKRILAVCGELADGHSARDLAQALIGQKLLTVFQASSLLKRDPLPLVLGDYEILQRIGAGGMGEVYKARHRRMKRIVALKILPHQLTDDELALKRFNREVEIVASLEHPNIVTAHDAGEQAGTHYLIMQFVDGCDLAERVRSGGLLSMDKAVEYSVQAARGLVYAHGEGVFHRDIKPSNLLVDKRGRIKILDLGLARVSISAARQIEHREGLTTTGAVMGTVDYLAPEQAVDSRTADHRADIYSLGCTLHYLLTGRAPYTGETMMQRLLAHREQPVPSLRRQRANVPESLDNVFQKMLAKQPDDRFSSMAEVVAALEAIVLPESASAAPEQLDNGDATIPHTVRPTDQVPPEDSTATLDHQPLVAVAGQNPDAGHDTLDRSASDTYRLPAVQPATNRSRSRLVKWVALALLVVGGGAFLTALLLSVTTSGGTLVFHGDPAVLNDVTISVDGEHVDLSIDGETFTVDVEKNTGDVRVVTTDGTELLAERFTFRIGQKRLPLSVGVDPGNSGGPERASGDNQRLATTADRVAAQWVLEMGGIVRVRTGDAKIVAESATDLPPDTFELFDIKLYGNKQIKDSDLVRLANLRSLEALDLGATNISDAGITRLTDLPALLYLTLSDTKITNHSLKHVSRVAPRLVQINMYGGTQVTDDGLSQLAPLRRLDQVLVHGNNRLTDAGLATLIEQDRQLIYISSKLVTGAGLEQIRPDARLTNLDLTDSSIGDDAVKHLRNTKLTHLGLARTNVTDACIEHLIEIPTLWILELSGTGVTEVGVRRLSKAVPACRIAWDGGIIEPIDVHYRRAAVWVLQQGGTLSSTSLGRNVTRVDDIPSNGPFRFRGVKLTLAEPMVDDLSLLNDVELSSVYLSGAGVSDQLLDTLGPSESLRQLIIEDALSISNRFLRRLAEFPQLTTLEIYRSRVTDLSGIEALVHLDKLNLSDLTLTDDSMRLIASLPKLRSIMLLETDVSDDGLRHLAAIESLDTLRLRNVPITDDAVADLAGLPLEWIELDKTNTGDQSLQILAGVPTIKLLTTGADVTDDGLTFLARFPQLESLRLLLNQVTAHGLARLGDAPKLTHLSLLGRRLTREDYESIGSLSSVTSLELFDVTDDSLLLLQQAGHLKTLTIGSAAGVTVDGLRAFMDALPDCKIEVYQAEVRRLVEQAREQ